MSKTAESNAPSSYAADGAAPAGPSTSLMSRVQRCLLKRWKEIALAAVPCAVVAVVLGYSFGKNVYQIEATLEYQEPQAPKALDGVYKPKDFNTLKESLRDADVLQAMAQASQLNIPSTALKKAIKVDTPIDTQKINITLEWENNEKGAEMLNKLMTVFVADVGARRKQRLDELKKAMVANLKNCTDRQDVADRKYKEFAEKASTDDIKKELDSLKNEIVNAEKEVEGPSAELKAIDAQIQDTQERIKDLGSKSSEVGKVAQEKRIKELQDKLDAEEENWKTNKKILASKTAARETDLALLAKKILTQKEFDDREEAYLKIYSDVKKSEKLVKSLREQIEIEKKNPTFPEMEAAKSALTTFQNTRKGIAARFEEKQKKLMPLQARARKLNSLWAAAEPTDIERKAIAEERKKLEEQQRELDNLLRDDSKLFKGSAAVAPRDPLYNTAKKIAPIAFALPMFLFVGFLLVRDMRTSDWQAESLVNQLGLPLLGRLTHEGRPEIDPTEARTLALRLRQFVPEEGGTILFSPINDGNEVDELLGQVGRFLAMRDERVLIVDTRIAQTEPATLVRHVERPVEMIAAEGVHVQPAPGLSGLVQYLVFEGHELREFIQPTGLGSVDFLPAGGPYPLTDVLASDLMKDLIMRLRKDYSVILLAGPAVTHTTDTEILAAYVHGMVVVLNGSVSGAAPLGEFFQSLREANAPLLGAVLCG